jgi:hypothetical protein
MKSGGRSAIFFVSALRASDYLLNHHYLLIVHNGIHNAVRPYTDAVISAFQLYNAGRARIVRQRTNVGDDAVLDRKRQSTYLALYSSAGDINPI